MRNRYLKEIILLLIVIQIIQLTSSILPSVCTSTEEPRYGGTLVDCTYEEVCSFNPVVNIHLSDERFSELIFEGLIQLDKDKQPTPQLAIIWEISANKLDYTFFLREDVYWHDNTSFTADDVIFTYDRYLDPRTYCYRSYPYDLFQFEYLDKDNPYEKLDDYTVVFHLNRVYHGMLYDMRIPLISQRVFQPYCNEEGESEFLNCPPNSAPVGTGSMMFDSCDENGTIVLIRNSLNNGGPSYWEEHNAYLDKYILKIIPEVTTQLLAFKNSEIDMMEMSSIEDSEIEGIIEDPKLNVYTVPQFTSYHIAFNCDPSKGHHADTRDFIEEPNLFAGFEWMENDPTKLPGPNIRKALNYALNKEFIIQEANPFGIRDLGPQYYAYREWYNDQVNPYAFNLSFANQLLGEAGFGYTKEDQRRKEINITLSKNVCCSCSGNSICRHAKNQWQDYLGISVAIEAVEWVSMLDSHYDHRKFDAMSAGWWSSGDDPDLTSVWHSRNIMPGGNPSGFNPDIYTWEWTGDPFPGGYNYAGYWNPEVDTLFDRARTESDRTLQKELCDRIQKQIVDDCPYVWIYNRVELQGCSSDVHGLVNSSLASIWAYPTGFHNIWKSVHPMEESSETSGRTTSTFDYGILIISLFSIGLCFIIGAGLAKFLRRY